MEHLFTFVLIILLIGLISWKVSTKSFPIRKNVMTQNMAFNTILIKSSPGSEWFIKERIAAEVLTPGMLLDVDSSGEYVKHPTAIGDGSPIVCVEEEQIGGLITDTYAINDTVRAVYGRSGDEFYMRLKTGNSVTPASLLVSDGAGGLQLHAPRSVDENGSNTWTQQEQPALFRSLETRNNTSGGYENTQVEVM